jgi:phage-related protein
MAGVSRIAMNVSPIYVDSDIIKRPSKLIRFMGSSLADLRALSESGRRNCGFQLYKLQCREEPDDWKPMPIVGAGACEIRAHDERGEVRVIYVAKFPDAIYVLHVFGKKTRKTAARDLRLAMIRYNDLTKAMT